MATIKISDLKTSFNDHFFFDTNIWLLLFGTVSDFQIKDQKAYSKLLDTLITKDNPIIISSLVISEFSNVLLRIDFKQWCSNKKIVEGNFKRDYVGTNEYLTTVYNISNTVNKILKLPNIQRVPDNFHSINIENTLLNFKIVDYNDAYIFELSKNNKYRIVTNDKDFQKLDSIVDIITTQV